MASMSPFTAFLGNTAYLLIGFNVMVMTYLKTNNPMSVGIEILAFLALYGVTFAAMDVVAQVLALVVALALTGLLIRTFLM